MFECMSCVLKYGHGAFNTQDETCPHACSVQVILFPRKCKQVNVKFFIIRMWNIEMAKGDKIGMPCKHSTEHQGQPNDILVVCGWL